MPSKRRLRRQDVDHSDTPLIVYPVGRKSGRPTGPIPEFLAKKQAERASKTYEWYRDSLTQLWEFLERHDLVMVGRFGEQAVHLFRLHLREKGVSENTVSNRLRAIKAFARWLAEKAERRPEPPPPRAAPGPVRSPFSDLAGQGAPPTDARPDYGEGR